MGIDLFSPPDPFYRYFRSGGSIYWFPRTALGGTKSHVTPERRTGAYLHKKPW